MAGRITDRKIKNLISALEEGRTIRAACRMAGISRRSYYRLLKTEEFAEMVEDAYDVSVSKVEDAVYEEAIIGEPITSTNRQTGEVEIVGRRRNPKLLEYLAKTRGRRGREPGEVEDWSDVRRTEVTGKDGGPIKTDQTMNLFGDMTPDEVREHARKVALRLAGGTDANG